MAKLNISNILFLRKRHKQEAMTQNHSKAVDSTIDQFTKSWVTKSKSKSQGRWLNMPLHNAEIGILVLLSKHKSPYLYTTLSDQRPYINSFLGANL